MQIEDLRNRPHLSASGIADYLECGLLYKFSRQDQLPPERIADSLVLGKAVHAVLAYFYQELKRGRFLTLKHLEEAFAYHWDRLAHGRYDIAYKSGKSFHSCQEEGQGLLAAFLQQLPREECAVLGVEEPFVLEITGLPVPLIGVYDLVLEDAGGVITIVDHKTASKAYSLNEVNQNLQMTIYHLAARANGYGDREILLHLDCLIKTKVPKFEQFYTTRGEWEERCLVKKIMAVWEGINKNVFIPNDTSWKCRGCGYQRACRDWFAAGGQ